MTSIQAPKRRVLSDLAAARVASLPMPGAGNGLGSAAETNGGQLANLPLFSDLDPTTLHALIQQARPIELATGEELFRQGDDSKSLFVVVDGAVVPIAEGGSRQKLAVLERGALVGEIGLVTRQPRNATVTALVDSKLLAIDRSALFVAMRSHSALAEGILRPARQRMLDRQLRTHLFFASFAPAERGAVARQFRLIEVKAGTKLLEQGKPASGLHVVLAGSFSRIEQKRGRELGTLGLGEVIGGHSLLEGAPSQFDVVANGKAWVLVLGERRFRKLVHENPRLVRVVQRLSASRPRPSDQKQPALLPRAASADRAPRSRS